MNFKERFGGSYQSLKTTFALCLGTVLVSVILLDCAHQPQWRGHLQADTVIYQNRACAFLESHSWGKIPDNEYQPGALWWVTLPAIIPLDCRNYEAYLTAFWLLNLLLLGALAALARKFGPPEAPWMLLVLALASGPILLYRFELTVSLMVMAAWLLWERRLWWSSSITLGVATSTKVYPLVLLPLVVCKAYREEGIKAVIHTVTGFVFGLGVVLGAYLWAGGTLSAAYSALIFHKHKPIGVDGLMGGVIPLLEAILGMPVKMTPQNSIHGFAFDAFCLGPLLDWVWIPIYLGCFFLMIRRRPSGAVAGVGAVFALLLAFLVMQKTYTPQYSWWVASLMPMIPADWLSKSRKTTLFMIALLALILGQVIYPLHYQELLDSFYNGHPMRSPVFWLNLFKNVLWLIALLIAVRPALSARISATHPEMQAATKKRFTKDL